MGTARTKANNKWNAKAYDRVNLVLKKDTSPTKDEVQAAADAEGVSLNAYIVAAISQQLNKGGAIMSEREQAKQIIDTLPDYKMQAILMFLRGVEFDDELEDDRFCEKLVDDYLNDDSPDKHESISLEEFAAQEGIAL